MKTHPAAVRAAVTCAFLFLVLVCLPLGRAADDKDREVPPDAAALVAALQAEADLTFAATKLAADGDVKGAWRLLASASSPAGKGSPAASQLGHRAMTVAGFLRNANHYAEAEALARLALAARWSDPRNAADATERALVRFWRAQIAADILENREQALAWAEERGDKEDEDERMPALRDRLRQEVEAHRHNR